MNNIQETISTKDRIAKEALNLFRTKGYSATSVREIAAAVGIKDSSLYNHYKSKQEIFNHVIEVYSKSGERTFFPFYQKDKITKESLSIFCNLEMITAMAKDVFISFTEDDESNQLRQMLITEMYHNDLAKKAYAKYLKEPLVWTAMLFNSMMSINFFKKSDAQVLAYEYMTPVYTLLTEYECGEISTTQALDFIERHITLFYQNHISEESF